MVLRVAATPFCPTELSVLALSSRFDGPAISEKWTAILSFFQYSLCRVVLMVPQLASPTSVKLTSFSTRSVESF